MLFLNLNPEIVDCYLPIDGELTYVKNKDQIATHWMNKASTDCKMYVRKQYYRSDILFRDTIGGPVSSFFLHYENGFYASFLPFEKMFSLLSGLYQKPMYKYRAFEILVTLDLEIYKATRRLIVPANIELSDLSNVLINVFNWRGYHLHDFTILDESKENPILTIVNSEEGLEIEDDAIMETGCRLSEFFPKYKFINYQYDFGDCWNHLIKLVRVIDDYDDESPYLLEAKGQTPPEDVGGITGFTEFREGILDPKHEEYEHYRRWSEYWQPKLQKSHSRPRVIRIW
jgi:hypothetical protein